MEKKITRIGVFTSGGDSPGMNAAIRSVVRSSIYFGYKVVGIKNGYQGMIEGDFIPMDSASVSNIIQRGGTILQTARSKEFMQEEGRKKAFKQLQKANIDALVAIGGNGTFAGAETMGKEFQIPIVGIPGTIDNDLFGTDYTIGYDTALNTVIEAVDKIRDTASSHHRLFFIEVMGRDAGFIALNTGIACGAEDILIPEETTSVDELIGILDRGFRHNKNSGIIIVAEGDDSGGALKIAEKVKQRFDHYETRVTILGHIQRGGTPTCADRVLASRLGYEAVNALHNGYKGIMTGIVDDQVAHTPLSKAIKHHNFMNKDLLEIARVLSL
ncbi:MAG: 6-phosphofructokinase [Bacteroidetes bacterium]|nr:MAG: 6-phosphofructokinase [Bacteroidota bacterium]PIE88416.1 MAG: 6-phosphofructokinase [Bacteroidota bacterium]